MLNVKQIQSVREAPIELINPATEEPLGAFVTLRSSEHPERRQALLDYQRILRKIGEGEGEEQVRRRHEAHVQYVVSCISAWQGIGEGDEGADFKETAYSAPAATELLSRPEMAWLLTQISLQIIQAKNFIAAQPKA